MVIVDERVADGFSAPGDDLERFAYGFSVFHCLPVGMIDEGAAGTGTVMRVDTVKSYAEKAGFGTFEVLPIENDFCRFYRLIPLGCLPYVQPRPNTGTGSCGIRRDVPLYERVLPPTFRGVA